MATITSIRSPLRTASPSFSGSLSYTTPFSSVGRGTLRFRNLDWLGEYIRARARPLGLL